MSTSQTTDPQTVVTRALARMGEIATLPEVTVHITQVVENPKSTAKDLHDILKSDPALSAKLLRVVNSAFYGLSGRVASVERAIMLLGMSAVKNLAVASSISRLFRGLKINDQYTAKDVWRHSLGVATLCRLLANSLEYNGDEVFLAGLIHDLGILVERQIYADKLTTVVSTVEQTGQPFCAAETEVIGADHQAFGEALAAKWRFPESLQAVLGYHHAPDGLADELYQLVSLVRLADVACCQLQLGFPLTCSGEAVDAAMLAAAGIDRVNLDESLDQLPEALKKAESILT